MVLAYTTHIFTLSLDPSDQMLLQCFYDCCEIWLNMTTLLCALTSEILVRSLNMATRCCNSSRNVHHCDHLIEVLLGVLFKSLRCILSSIASFGTQGGFKNILLNPSLWQGPWTCYSYYRFIDGSINHPSARQSQSPHHQVLLALVDSWQSFQ